MEMDNEIFKQNDTDQVKRNATKLEYTNQDKNINGSHSSIQKILIQNQIIHNYQIINNYSEQRKITFLVINNFSSIQDKRNENKFITVYWYLKLIYSSKFDHSVNSLARFRVQ